MKIVRIIGLIGFALLILTFIIAGIGVFMGESSHYYNVDDNYTAKWDIKDNGSNYIVNGYTDFGRTNMNIHNTLCRIYILDNNGNVLASSYFNYQDLTEDMYFIEVYNISCNKTNMTGTPYSVWVDVMSSQNQNNNATSVHILGNNETVVYDGSVKYYKDFAGADVHWVE